MAIYIVYSISHYEDNIKLQVRNESGIKEEMTIYNKNIPIKKHAKLTVIERFDREQNKKQGKVEVLSSFDVMKIIMPNGRIYEDPLGDKIGEVFQPDH